MQLLVNEYRLINTDFSKLICELVLKRYNERRDKKLISILEFFKKRNSIHLGNIDFPLNTQEEIIRDTIEIANVFFQEFRKDAPTVETLILNPSEDTLNEEISFTKRLQTTSNYSEELDKSIVGLKSGKDKNDLKSSIDDYVVTGRLTSFLRKIIEQISAMKSTSVDSERVFSIAGGIVTKSRNRMSDRMLNMILVLKHYFLNK